MGRRMSGPVQGGGAGQAAARWRRAIVISTLSGGLLALLGPFGTYLNGGPGSRALYWIGAAWAGCALYGGAITAVGRIAPRGTAGRRWLLGAAVGAASLAEAVLTRMAAFALWPSLRAHAPGIWVWLAQTLLIGAMAAIVAEWLLSRRPLPADAAAVPAALQAGAPARQMPAGAVALQMEDHYVRVHTATGSSLIHLSMTAAIAALGQTEGLRVHRSWWVARQSVQAIEGTPRAMRVRLGTGLSVPVARSAVSTLREAGWLATP